MSRVVWGAVSAGSIKKQHQQVDPAQQPTLDGFLQPLPPSPTTGTRKRERAVEEGEGTAGRPSTRTSGGSEHPLPLSRERTDERRSGAAVARRTSGTASGSAGTEAEGPTAVRNPPGVMGMSPQQFLGNQPDDAVCWGPSGGGDREAMGRRRPRPFMNGKEMNVLFNKASPYSRPYVAAWQEQLAQANEDNTTRAQRQGSSTDFTKEKSKTEQTKAEKKESSSVKREEVSRTADRLTTRPHRDGNSAENSTTGRTKKASLISTRNTEFDESLLEPYLAPDCPRNLFSGKVFYLNSCDTDERVSTYVLEKIIRHLGGVTSMAAGGFVDYIVTQHLCSAKEKKVLGKKRKGVAAGGPAGSRSKYIHPHFVLDSAMAGKLVGEAPYRTIAMSSTLVQERASGGEKRDYSSGEGRVPMQVPQQQATGTLDSFVRTAPTGCPGAAPSSSTTARSTGTGSVGPRKAKVSSRPSVKGGGNSSGGPKGETECICID